MKKIFELFTQVFRSAMHQEHASTNKILSLVQNDKVITTLTPTEGADLLIDDWYVGSFWYKDTEYHGLLGKKTVLMRNGKMIAEGWSGKEMQCDIGSEFLQHGDVLVHNKESDEKSHPIYVKNASH